MADCKSALWNGIAIALIILALTLGIGKCDRWKDDVMIVKEKTKQLELQLKIEQEKTKREYTKESTR